MYKCNHCKFSAKYNSDFERHLKTKTHIKLVKKSEERKNNKNKIINHIDEKLSDIKKTQTLIQTQQLITDDKVNKINKQQLITDDKVNKINKNVKKIYDAVDLLNEHCLDAEVLTELTEEDVEELLKLDTYKKNKFGEMIIKYVKCGKLHEKIGELIQEKYLNDDNPKEQQFWISDITRLIYLILQMINDEKIWFRDKKGVRFTKLIMDPIITKLQELMSEYAKYTIKLVTNKYEDELNNSKYLEYTQLAKNFDSKIYCNKLIKNILKYLADKFSISSKRDELSCSK